MVCDYVLTLEQLQRCACDGIARRLEDVALGRKERGGGDHNQKYALLIDITGCIGEMVLSLHLNVPYKGKGRFRGADVDEREQARCRMEGLGGHLWVDRDPKVDLDGARYWFVSSELPRFRVHGWMLGRDGRHFPLRTMENGRICHWIPAHALTQADVVRDRELIARERRVRELWRRFPLPSAA
jgi:hypothetical protein